jgi:hypothetical protein
MPKMAARHFWVSLLSNLYIICICINLGFERAKWFAKFLGFAAYLVHMSLLSTKPFHLGMDLLNNQP